MKIIAFLCTLLIFSFSSSSEVGTNLAGSDVKAVRIASETVLLPSTTLQTR